MGVDKDTVKTIVEDAVPFFNLIGLKLNEITNDSVTLSLPFTESVKNHIGTHYAAGIFTVAEACGGAIFALKADITRYLIILKAFEIRFLKPSAEDIYCTLKVSDKEMNEVLKIANDEGKYDWKIEFEVKNKNGDTIATCKGTYHIRKLY